jgi:hypothetical protein
MSRADPRPAPDLAGDRDPARFTLDVVVPVHDEEADLEPSVRRLRTSLDERFPFPAIVTIADNPSTDRTWEIAQRLAVEVAGVRALHLDRKGRGLALRQAWLGSEAPIVAYPVGWVDDPDSRVAIVPTATADLRGVWRLLPHPRRVEGASIMAGMAPEREAGSAAWRPSGARGTAR